MQTFSAKIFIIRKRCGKIKNFQYTETDLVSGTAPERQISFQFLAKIGKFI